MPMGGAGGLLGKYWGRGCKGNAEWRPLGVQGAMCRWAGAVCGWGAAPGISISMSSGGSSRSKGRGVGDWVMVEGQQAGRLGDPLGGRPGGGLQGRLEGQVGWQVPVGLSREWEGAGMGCGLVVFSKSEEQPRSTKLTERDVAGTLCGCGEDGVVVTVVGSSNTGLRWVVKAVGVACSRRVTYAL